MTGGPEEFYYLQGILRKCALFSSPGGKYLTTLHGDHEPFQNEFLTTKLPTRWSETRFAGLSAEGSWNQAPLPTLLFWILATATNTQQSSMVSITGPIETTLTINLVLTMRATCRTAALLTKRSKVYLVTLYTLETCHWTPIKMSFGLCSRNKLDSKSCASGRNKTTIRASWNLGTLGSPQMLWASCTDTGYVIASTEASG